MTMTQNKVIALEQQDLYETSDLAIAAAISLWYPIEAIDRAGSSTKARFLFKRDTQLDQLVESFWRGELRVNPQTYFQALKIIKARLYENTR